VIKINVRKLIAFGKNSYVISLPKQWVDKNRLKKGDLVSLDEKKDGLLLRVKENGLIEDEPMRVVVNSDNKSLGQLKTEIVSAYLNNYNIIEVVSKDLKTNALRIRDRLRDLTGLEIINQSSTRIVAKDIINVNNISIKTLIRRMDNITRSMMLDTVECFDGIDHADNIEYIDEEVNRLHFLAYRIIRSGLSDFRTANSSETSPLKLHSSHTVTKRIERIADNTKLISRYLRETKLDKKWKNELKIIFDGIRETYNDVMKAYYTGDEKMALEIEEKRNEKLELCDTFFERHDHKHLRYNE